MAAGTSMSEKACDSIDHDILIERSQRLITYRLNRPLNLV